MIDIDCTIGAIFNALNKDIGDNFDFVIAIRQSRTLWDNDPTIVRRPIQRTLESDFDESESFDSALHPHRVPDKPPRPDIRSRLIQVQALVQLNVDRSKLAAVCD